MSRAILALLVSLMCPGFSLAGPTFGRPPRVVDAAGKAIATVISDENGDVLVWRREPDAVVRFYVVRDGTSIEGGGAGVYYESADCSGQPYVPSEPGRLAKDAMPWPPVTGVAVTELIYAGEPVQAHTLRATKQLGVCQPVGEQTMTAGPLRSIDMRGYLLPFKVK